MKIQEVEKSLKRFLKKKGSFSAALLVMFLITGTISLGGVESVTEINGIKENILVKIKQEREKIKAKIKENESKISEETAMFDTLVKEWDFYGKPLGQNTQVFFTYDKINSGSGKDRTKEEWSPTIDAAISSGMSREEALNQVNSGLGSVITSTTFRETIDIGVNIKPVEPNLPSINPNIAVNVSIPTVNLGTLPGTITPVMPTVQEVTIPVVSVPTSPNGVTVAIAVPGAVDKIDVTAPNVTTPQIPPDKNIAIPEIVTPVGFIPTIISPPAKPEAPQVVMPENFMPPALDFVGKGFPQHGRVRMLKQHIILENYKTYDTTAPIIITTGENETAWIGGNIEAYTDVPLSTTPSGADNVLFNEIGVGNQTLVPGTAVGNLNAFINELRDHNATIDGDYVMTDLGGGNDIKIFLSHNPAGVGETYRYDGKDEIGERRSIFKGTLELHGISGTNDKNILVGVEHQLWNQQTNAGSYSVFENKGEITLASGNNMIGIMIDVEAQDLTSIKSRDKTINTGKIIINSKNSIGIDFGSYRNYVLRVDVTLGNIEVNGENNYGFRMYNVHGDESPNYFDQGVKVESGAGKIIVGGRNNVGVSISKSLSTAKDVNPIANIEKLNIEVTGENVVGFLRNANYSTNNIGDMILNNSTMGEFTFGTGATKSVLIRSDKYGIQIDKNLTSSKGSTGNVFAQATSKGKIINNAVLESSLNGFIGLLSSGTTTDHTANVNNVGTIKLTGTGNQNIGIAVLDATGQNSGTIEVGGVGTNKAGIYNKGTFKVSNGSKITVSGEKSSGIYNENILNISGKVDLAISKGAIGIYSNGGTISSTSADQLSIKLDDSSNQGLKGTAIYATGGANINVQGASIDVKEGASGIASIEANSVVNFTDGYLKYDGDSYAVYSDGKGIVNLSGATLELHGTSTAFDLDLNLPTPSIILNSTSKIKVESDGVTVFNLKNVTGLDAEDLEASIVGIIGGSLGTGVNLGNLIEAGAGIDKYKIANADGGTITIGSLDRTGTGAIGETEEQLDGNFYYNRFLGQRLVATTLDGSTISAVLDTVQASKYNGQVVGFEMNSSRTATTNSEAAINLVGSIVKADRTDSGTGAMGLFINYGKVTVDGTSKIEIEKNEISNINKGGVGVYSVNGSDVTIAQGGTIDVAGDEAFGILGIAYRKEAAGNPIIDEFGAGVGQGKINISNSGIVTLTGKGSIGIYAENNNNTVTGIVGNANIVNTATGILTVGNSSDDATAIGIYGDKVTISNLGKISVGDNGIAIYAKTGTMIKDIGILDLGANAIGVMLDGTSDISATNLTLTSNNVGLNGKTGVFYKGTGGESKSLNLGIDASTLEKVTSIYIENMNVSSSGTLKVGKEGVGIFAKGTSANTGTNIGTIELSTGKTGAVGMYSKTANVANITTGVINVNDSSQIGMYVEGLGNKAINTGIINLNVDSSTGIYLKSGAITEISNGANIVFNGNSSVGIFAEGATVNFKDSMTFTNSNEEKNILVYGKDATVGINAGEIVKVDGVSAGVTVGNKAVGIYLEKVGSGNTFNGIGNVEVSNEAIGLYSKGENTLNVNVTAIGEGTTGIFIDGGSTISGTVTAQGIAGAGAIGVYGSEGAVTIGTTGLTLKTDAATGTGMYLTDGSFATGGIVTVNNISGTENIGVYYNKGTSTTAVTNNSELSLIGSKSVGIYADGVIQLTNTKNIVSSAGVTNSIASYINGNSQLTSTGNIILNDSVMGIGIYAEEGKGINSGIITLNGVTSDKVGMVAEAKATGKVATVENQNILSVGSNLGMYIAGVGTSSGKNTGTINVIGVDTTPGAGDKTGTGVYVDGSGNSFDGTGGTINSNTIGIYLKDTDASKINTGILNIAAGGIGVFGENAKIDFEVNTSSSSGEVGVAAKTNSVISGNVTVGQGSVGVYLLDDTVSFNGTNIVTGTNVPAAAGIAEKTSIGILFHTGITGAYTLNNVSVNAKNGVGIYMDGVGMDLTHNGVVTTEGGIGIYATQGTSLTTGTSTINIDGGTGIFVDGGTANVGTTGNLTFNFVNGGTGVYNKDGILNLGTNINVIGSGSLVVTSNGSVNSTGVLNVGEGSTGIYGIYDVGTTGVQSIINSGTITAISGGMGVVATKGATSPSGVITLSNTGIINAEGKSSTDTPSIGMFTDVANVENTGKINVGNNGIGIYSNHNGIMTSVKSDEMTMTGTDGIGVYIKGATDGLISNVITSTGSKNTGVVLENVIASSINLGTITLGNESIGVMSTGAGHPTNPTILDGTIVVKDSSVSKSAIGIVVNNGSKVTLAGTASVEAGNSGIGIYAEGGTTKVTVSDISKIKVGVDGIYLYSKGAELNFIGNLTVDNQIGIVAEGGTINGTSAITVLNGGIGAYVKGSVLPTFGTTTIAIQAGTESKYSIGVYYDGLNGAITGPTITQTGNYTIGMVLNSSTGTKNDGINIGGTGISNQVGVMVKENSIFTIGNTTAINIIGGDNNIGIYGENSTITVNGDISVGTPTSVGPATDPMKYSSVGVFATKGSYTGTGNVSVGNNSIGIYGKDLTGGSIEQTGSTMNVGDNGVGIYGSGTGNIKLTIGTINLNDNNSIGVYAKGTNSNITGNITVGTNTSIGIVSEGNGDATYSGNMNIADKATSGSIGIYKTDGTGNINTTGNWDIGDSGYGIYLKQSTGKVATITNGANMILGTSTVGIYSNGANTITNTGDITVGATNVQGDHVDARKHLNSIGMYITGGTVATNTGIITVNYDHSIGVYGDGAGTKFTNTGTMNVDNGGIGILVRDGAIAVNAVGANINLGSTLATCGATTVGMAAYNGSKIENAGTITVNEGVGMLLGIGATFSNTGTIVVKNGIGIEGGGSLTNSGNIVITGTGVGTGTSGTASAQIGAVEIKPDGTVIINGNYTSIGGSLSTVGNIIVNGAYVDVTTGTPLFNADSVTGEINLLPNFATTGNGISYEIEGFVTTAGSMNGGKFTPVTSPLFVAKVTETGSLIIAKRPYADLTVGDQFDALEKGLDNILANSGGNGNDADILMGMNEYLEGLRGEEFTRETGKVIAETRGDIYGTIQGRMQDVNRAFDNSFDELLNSYNPSRQSDKFSVLYTEGDFKDPTVGISDYDYDVKGLLYMHEKEGLKYGTKYGYTLGFTGSAFKFDDDTAGSTGSEEDIYSLRIGAHREQKLGTSRFTWLTRGELAYNYHDTERDMQLGPDRYKNEAGYSSYGASFKNELSYTAYSTLSTDLKVYGGANLEYGAMEGFTEKTGSKGGLELEVKGNDYFIGELEAGLKGSKKIYLGKNINLKVSADAGYAYDLGDNYPGNKAKLKNGGEGYYDLITTEKAEGSLRGKVGLGLEKANHYGVTFEVEWNKRDNRSDEDIKYSARLNYKF